MKLAKEEKGRRLGYRFRIYPTPEQKRALNMNIGCCRFVFNHYLAARKAAWERTQETLRRPKPAVGADGEPIVDPDGREVWERGDDGKVVYIDVPNEGFDPAARPMSFFDTSKDLTRLKREVVDANGHAWLRDADATALIYALRNLDNAYQLFFKGRKAGRDVGYPRFKSRGNEVQSYKTGGVRLIGLSEGGERIVAVDELPSACSGAAEWTHVYLPKVGEVRARVHRAPEGRIVSATMSRDAAGRWFCSLGVKEASEVAAQRAEGAVGITYGAAHWAVTSDGEVFDLPARMERLMRRKVKAQRKLARKELHSHNWAKQKLRVGRAEAHIADARRDATHKLTSALVGRYGTICARQMASKEMQQHKGEATKDLPKKVQRRLNRQIADGNFFEVNRQLAYKSAWASRAFALIPSDAPTAQVCSRCGHREESLAGDLRPKWTCPECGAAHDRKGNGAENVLEAGLDILRGEEESFVTKAMKGPK